MKVIYQPEERTVVINDNQKQQYYVVNTILGLTCLNSLLRILGGWQPEADFIWIILGVVSLAILIYQLARKTVSESIGLGEIESLKERDFLGRKSLRLRLRSGKHRDILEFEKMDEMKEVLELFRRCGIRII